MILLLFESEEEWFGNSFVLLESMGNNRKSRGHQIYIELRFSFLLISYTKMIVMMLDNNRPSLLLNSYRLLCSTRS